MTQEWGDGDDNRPPGVIEVAVALVISVALFVLPWIV